jgi:hypothetical protein
LTLVLPQTTLVGTDGASRQQQEAPMKLGIPLAGIGALVGAAVLLLSLPAASEARAGLTALLSGPGVSRPLIADGLSEAELLGLSAFEPASHVTPVKLPVACATDSALAHPVETHL